MRVVGWDDRSVVRAGTIPDHVAIIMDGNRRWGAARGIAPENAHAAASLALASCIREAAWLGISHLTFFALAARNLRRAPEEVVSLLKLREWLFTSEVMDALGDSAQAVNVIGEVDHEEISRELACVKLSAALSNDAAAGLRITFAVNYSSRLELKTSAYFEPFDAGQGLMRVHSRDSPDIDLLIRPGGEQRLSDFMLWHIANAELVFTDTLWPDFRGLHLASAVCEFQQRRRRFGQ